MQITYENITQYIDEALKKTVEFLKGENKKIVDEIDERFLRHNTALFQSFREEQKKAEEMTRSYTTKTDVKKIVDEETKPLQTKVGIIEKKVSKINKKLASI